VIDVRRDTTDPKPTSTCRCGFWWSDEAFKPHPCHGNVYSCGKPAKRRFYNPSYVSLAGMQMKVGVHETWACDECWDKYPHKGTV
jgi:hypothetical protein